MKPRKNVSRQHTQASLGPQNRAPPVDPVWHRCRGRRVWDAYSGSDPAKRRIAVEPLCTAGWSRCFLPHYCKHATPRGTGGQGRRIKGE